MGPVDYMVLLFPGNKFQGKIAPEIARLESMGIIRVIDLIFVIKDARGKVRTIESRDLGGEAGEAFRRFSTNIKDWLCLDDIEVIGDALPKNSSAAAMLLEHTWAIKLKESLLETDAQMISYGRIPHELVLKVMEERILPGGA